jgi:hypothetical protein
LLSLLLSSPLFQFSALPVQDLEQF